MSEARRKRQEKREGTAPRDTKKYFVWGGVVVLIVLAYLGLHYQSTHKYDTFAKCLTAHGAKMYGLYWCPHCIEQKKMFGESFRYVDYVECAVKGLCPAKSPGSSCFPVGNSRPSHPRKASCRWTR
jgi:hypothetical protein